MNKNQRQIERTAQMVAAMREFLQRFPDESEASAARWAVTGSVRMCNNGKLAQIKVVRETYAAGK